MNTSTLWFKYAHAVRMIQTDIATEYHHFFERLPSTRRTMEYFDPSTRRIFEYFDAMFYTWLTQHDNDRMEINSPFQ